MSLTDEKNYYELLGLTPEASPEQIKEAFKEIAKIYHPDSNFYHEIVPTAHLEPEQLKTFQLISAAYTVLSNVQKRAAYDATLPRSLKGWNDDSRDIFERPDYRPASEAQNKKIRSKFGTVTPTGDNRSGENLRPVSEILRNRSFLGRIISFLGF